MTITKKELAIIGLMVHHYFEVGPEQNNFIKHVLEMDPEKYQKMEDGEYCSKVRNKALPYFNEILKAVHMQPNTKYK